MIYKIYNSGKLVETVINTRLQLLKYLKEHHPHIEDLNLTSLKNRFKKIDLSYLDPNNKDDKEYLESYDGVQDANTAVFDEYNITIFEIDNVKARTLGTSDMKYIRKIPKDLKKFKKKSYITYDLIEYDVNKDIKIDNYLYLISLIMDQLKLKGENFFDNHKILIVIEGVENIDGDITKKTFSSESYLDFNMLYEKLIEIFNKYFRRYEHDMAVKKIYMYYIKVPHMYDVVIYKGNEEYEKDIYSDLLNRMIFDKDSKNKLINLLKQYELWSPNTNKNCCIWAGFMAKYRDRDVLEKVKKFVAKNKIDKMIWSNIGPLLSKYLKCNINIYMIDTKIKTLYYQYKRGREDIYILCKGGHSYAMIEKEENKDIIDDTQEEIIIPKYNDELTFVEMERIQRKNKDFENIREWNIATYDTETCDINEKIDDQIIKNTIPYALGFYDGKIYKEIYKTEKEPKKDILLKFINYLLYGDHNKLIIYAHNGGKFDSMMLLKTILNTNKFVVTSFLESNGRILNLDIKGTININNTEVIKKFKFRDSINLISGSLDNACKSFRPSTKKLEGDVNHDKINESNCHTKEIYEYTKEYLKCDCKSLYEILTIFDDCIYSKYNFRMHYVLTNASIARRIFLSKFYNSELRRLYKLTKYADEKIRKYYFGGRNECMTKLGHIQGKIYYFDFTSLYPYVMKIYKYFFGKMNIINVDTKEFDKNWFGFVECEFRHINKNNLPYHPIIKDNKLIFPYCDNWQKSVLSTEDIRYSIENNIGYEYKFTQVFNWEQKSKYFKKPVSKLYEMKIESQKSGNKALRSISKIIINSLYGFFGINFMNREQTIIKNERAETQKTKEDSTECALYGYLLDQKLCDFAQIGDYDIYKIIDTIDCNCANVGIAAMVTSYARTELYKMMKKIIEKGGKIHYCDTDSIITDYNIYGDDDFKEFTKNRGDEMGELTNEIDAEIEGILKKMYSKKIISENKYDEYYDHIKIDDEYNKLYKSKVDNYIRSSDFYFKDLITLGNKMYALRSDFDYEGTNYKIKIIKMKGINSKQSYNKKEYDDINKKIIYTDIDGDKKGIQKIDFDDYIKMANGYKLICDNMNFLTGIKDLLIKDKNIIKQCNTKTIISLYDKANLDDKYNITPLIL